MDRTTIDFGIDLGTTNSAVAVLDKTEPEVFKNNENSEFTPSVVHIDQRERLYVGERAKQRLFDDPENTYAEFKRQMGHEKAFVFSRSQRKLSPVELSAEVLKSLKESVKKRSGEDMQAAVITVPAAFEAPQTKATMEAAKLAGFGDSPLLQEPVAAALAYGFQSEDEKVFWLVYDLGGGTFDAAVIQVRDGVISVVNHRGDNLLGGKNIDWLIVEQLLIPAVEKKLKLGDFRRDNPKWSAAIAKLKARAEEAKILLSNDDVVDLTVDPLFVRAGGEAVSFEFELTRAALERLIDPVIESSINMCQRVLSEKGLAPEHLAKVILVGGPTLTPHLRNRLSETLRVPLEYREDPLTVVARGAAVFARTQRLMAAPAKPTVVGQFAVQLEYKPVDVEQEPLIGGKVMAAAGQSLSGFTMEFVNSEARPPWRSGKIKVNPDGNFFATLWAEKGRANNFVLDLCDASGRSQKVLPDRLSYTIGVTISEQPLLHSLGVALANNEMRWFLEKGTPLPAKKRVILRTAREIRAGQSGSALKVPIMEGENTRADRNQVVGTLEITADQVRRTVPPGQEIEITIEIDASRQISTRAYLPMLEEEFEKVIELHYEKRDAGQMRKDLEEQKKRLQDLRTKASTTQDEGATREVQKLEGERLVERVEAAVGSASTDDDAANQAHDDLSKLQEAADRIEDALEWPALVARAEAELEVERQILGNPEYGVTKEERGLFAALESELGRAIQLRDVALVKRKTNELDRLGIVIATRQPAFWVGQFRQLENRRATMRNQGEAQSLFAQGERAMRGNDLEGLKSAIRALAALLPDDSTTQKIKSDVI
jgi:molecular chaperone DnaK